MMQIEDRPIVKEIKTYVREHHPVEKEFVVETRPTGMSLAVFGFEASATFDSGHCCCSLLSNAELLNCVHCSVQ